MKLINFDRVVNRIGTDAVKWDGMTESFSGVDVKDCLPMWVADSDFLVPEEVRQAVMEKAMHGVYGYPMPKGQAFDEAIIGWIKKRYEWSADPSWVVAAAGVVPAMVYAMQAFTKEGDGVIIQPPVYHPFKQSIINNKRAVSENALLYDGEAYTIDFNDFEKKASDPKNKMFILCNPHNPVGRVWGEEELRRLGEICVENDILVFSDEIHADLIFKGFKHIPLGKVNEDFEKNTITAYSPSKTFNMAGLRTSVVIIPDEKKRMQYKRQLAKNAAQELNVFGVLAFIAAYNCGEQYLEELLAYIEGNIDFAKTYIEKYTKGIKFIKPQGTYLVWMDFNGTGLSPDEINKTMVEKAKVAASFGKWFGKGGDGFLRFNFACPRATIEKAMEQIKGAFN